MLMVAARAAGRGLAAEDIESIRAQLAAGRRPKVVFTVAAGQIAGQPGQVVELTDPAGSDDFVVVRFGRDELPFSPTDLAIAPRGAAARRSEPKSRSAPEFILPEPPIPAPREEPSMPASPASGGDNAVGSASSSRVGGRSGAAKAAPAGVAAAEDSPAPLGDAPAAGKPRKAAKQTRPKAPAALTVTLSYAEGEWTVAANQGAKSLAKPYLIRASEAVKMVALLDVPGVQEAVEQIVAVERAEAEQQAQRLRAELAEIEAKLAELTDLR